MELKVVLKDWLYVAERSEPQEISDIWDALNLAYGDKDKAIEIINKREERRRNKRMKGDALTLSETLPLVTHSFKKWHSLEVRQY